MTGGYTVGRDYLHTCPTETSPAHLAALMVLRGRRSPALDAPFRYLDLGCGTGFALLVHAAANPQGRFVGVDLSADHVLRARDLAAAAGLENVEIHQASFADILADPARFGRFDFIVCHGVYTWVDAARRAEIAAILQHGLVLGGLACLGYNAMPGWAALQPLRDLIRRRVEGRRGPARAAAIEEAFDLFSALAAEAPSVVAQSEFLRRWVAEAREKPMGYLAHEYLPEAATALWHHEVAAAMEGAGLLYVGSARLAENFDRLSFSPAAMERIAAAEREGLGEMVRDLATTRTFRIDVFARGAPALAPAEADAALEALGIAAARGPDDPPTIRTARGEIDVAPGLSGPVLDLVRSGPCRLGEAADRAAAAGLDRARARSVLTALLAGGRLHALARLEPGEARAPCARFNAVVRRRLPGCPAFASPLTGGGIRLDQAEAEPLRDPAVPARRYLAALLPDLFG